MNGEQMVSLTPFAKRLVAHDQRTIAIYDAATSLRARASSLMSEAHALYEIANRFDDIAMDYNRDGRARGGENA